MFHSAKSGKLCPRQTFTTITGFPPSVCVAVFSQCRHHREQSVELTRAFGYVIPLNRLIQMLDEYKLSYMGHTGE